MSDERYTQDHSFDHETRKRMLGLFESLDKKPSKRQKHERRKEIKEKEPFYFVSRKSISLHRQTGCLKKEAERLKNHLHFVNFPIHELGNWIPYILGHWTCFGVGCALSQVAFKTRSGVYNIVIIFY